MTVVTQRLEIVGFANRPVPNLLWRHERRAEHLAVLFPGWSYTCQAPLLYYTRALLLELGADVLLVEYGYEALQGFRQLSSEEQDAAFFAEAGGALAAAADAGDYRQVTLVGKSIGTQAVSHLLRTDQRAENACGVFFTPTFGYGTLLDEIAEITQPCMFVLGTADAQHAPDRVAAARRKGPVLVIEDANHALDVPGSAAASIAAVSRSIEAVRAFLATP